MFRLYHHHDLDVLAALLMELRRQSTRVSVLEPDTILIPNRGTARWLQARLSESVGVAANLDLPVPGRFVWRVLRDTLPDQPDSTDFERERLVWHLYALLPTVDVPQVRRYLATAPQERHRYQLALQLADVFDAYLVHRRDVLRAWEAGHEGDEPPASWQAPVWRALLQRLGPRHRARLLTEFLERADSGELDVSRLPNPVYAFALDDLPADYLRLLYALGGYMEVHFLLPNPSTVYWGDVRRERVPPLSPALPSAAEEGAEVFARGSDDKQSNADPGSPGFRFASSGLRTASEDVARMEPKAQSGEPSDGNPFPDMPADHPLLASLGRAGRDLLRVLYSDEFAELHEPDLGEALAPEPPGEDTLLRRVQSGVIDGAAVAADTGMEADDASIQVHACHGPLREIQVLHDRLLDLLKRHPDLQPRDILVLLPDVARYAPAVYSVFGAATDSRYIPYSVSNRPRRDQHPIARTFQQLIELPLSRWTASEVLALAGVPAVMRRFELDEGDLDLLHQWVPAAGVRWGLDRETRVASGAADFGQNTWAFGLDRLLLGLAQRDEDTLVDGVAPWSDLEGGAATAVGRLWLLLDRLRHWRDRMDEPADAATWQERLNAMAGELFAIDREDAAETTALDTVHEALGVLEGAAASLGEEPLSREAVREALLDALAGGSQRQPLVTGGVTFAGLEPLRGVPFDVICMVGMDDGVFPRQDGQREFNLLQKHPRIGDPSVRDLERMTFLQSLMAARHCFYLSYTGRNVQDGEALQPSPVVGEFLDFLHGYHFRGRSRDEFRKALVTEQPMHPFSPRYFPTEPDRLFTFVDDWRRAAEAQQAERTAPEPFMDETLLAERDPDEPIDLEELRRFFRHPAQWFFREQMRLAFDEEGEHLDDEEPRRLGGIEKHLLRDRLFAHASEAGLDELPLDPDALERARGHLPPSPLGGTDYAMAAAEVNTILPLYWQWQRDGGANEDIDIDVALDDGTRVVGRVNDVGPREMRRVRPGSLRLNHLLPWWLEYLGVVAAGREVGLQVAGTGDEEADRRVGRIDPERARRYLRAAVDQYRAGWSRPVLFEPYLAEHYLDKTDQKTPEDALYSTNGWLNNRYRPPHPARDPWLKPLFAPSPDPLGESAERSRFVQVTEAVARPVREHLVPPETGE